MLVQLKSLCRNSLTLLQPPNLPSHPPPHHLLVRTLRKRRNNLLIPTASAKTPFPAVLNISFHLLTHHQLEALTYGFKFAPTPKEIPDTLEFFKRFQQRCTWVYSKVTGASKSKLPNPMQERVGHMLSNLQAIQLKSFISNVFKEVRTAIEQLKRNKELTIREADKGSCIVVMDTKQYITEGYAHLADTTIYQHLDRDRTFEVAHKANWALRHHKEVGALHQAQEANLYTQPPKVRTQEMYFPRKVHKEPHKIRPIVSCSSGPTEKISGFLCHLLTPHLDNVKSLITNTQQVVQTIATLDLSGHPNVTLVSLDLESLYLSIPQAIGIEMVLQRVPPTSPAQATYNSFKNLIRDLLKITIRDNTFRFHNDFYNQVKGVAMGTKCAPPFANLFLGSLEEQALESWSGPSPLLWLRFLDDVLMLWEGDDEQLSTFVQHLNNQMRAINFTMSKSQESITFLDLELYKDHRFRHSGILDTKLYKKPSNLQNFLHFSSCHSPSTFPTIVRGELLRALRATSELYYHSNKAVGPTTLSSR